MACRRVLHISDFECILRSKWQFHSLSLFPFSARYSICSIIVAVTTVSKHDIVDDLGWVLVIGDILVILVILVIFGSLTGEKQAYQSSLTFLLSTLYYFGTRLSIVRKGQKKRREKRERKKEMPVINK